MHKSSISRIKGTTRVSPEHMSFEDYLEEAEICCEQARIAGRQRRYRAAIGLFNTAATLYRHAGTIDGVSYPAIEERLRHIDNEMSAYSELARSMSRPFNAIGSVGRLDTKYQTTGHGLNACSNTACPPRRHAPPGGQFNGPIK